MEPTESKEDIDFESQAAVFCLRLFSVQLKSIRQSDDEDVLDIDMLSSLSGILGAIVSSTSAPSALHSAAQACFNTAIPMLYPSPLARLNLLISVVKIHEHQSPTTDTEKSSELIDSILVKVSPVAVAKSLLSLINDTLVLHDLVQEEPRSVMDTIQYLVKGYANIFMKQSDDRDDASLMEHVCETLVPLLTRQMLSFIVKLHAVTLQSTKNSKVKRGRTSKNILQADVERKRVKTVSVELLELFCGALATMLSVPSCTTVGHVDRVAKTFIGQLIGPILTTLTMLDSESLSVDLAETVRVRSSIDQVERVLNDVSQATSGAIFSQVMTTGIVKRDTTATHESPHNYLPNMNLVEEVTFPELAALMRKERDRYEIAVASAEADGKVLTDEEKEELKPAWLSEPRSVTLVWDKRTKTESGCDHIQVGFDAISPSPPLSLPMCTHMRVHFQYW